MLPLNWANEIVRRDLVRIEYFSPGGVLCVISSDYFAIVRLTTVPLAWDHQGHSLGRERWFLGCTNSPLHVICARWQASISGRHFLGVHGEPIRTFGCNLVLDKRNWDLEFLNDVLRSPCRMRSLLNG